AFIKTVCEAGKIWALENEEGFATSDSNLFEDEDEQSFGLFCFWSNQDAAKACAIDGWEDYTPTEIALSDFIEDWCVSMSDEDMLAGIDFDSDMYGYEVEPLKLILDLHAELKLQNKTLQFKKFKTIEELTAIVEDLMM
ncbi:DUF2750 domain-containing protein, partial [Odoribacter sp. OttesenSCG-928-J03]|nr:DUF2750 domain-containing protein [Odoribacter sp. OttesenSCG-928-J03]